MPTVYFDQQDLRQGTADLWAQRHLERLNREQAPPPPEPAPVSSEPTLQPVAADQNGGEVPTPTAVGPGPPSPAPAAAGALPAAMPPVAPSQPPASVDQWAKDKAVDAWAADALKDVTSGVSQTLSAVPPEGQAMARATLNLPAATPPQNAPTPPSDAISAPSVPPGQAATVAQPPSGGDLQQYAVRAAQRAGLDPDVFVRQIQQESGFNPSARSPAGAQGIAQIVPQYHPGVDVTDPYASLDYAANLMASHLKNNGGDMSRALAAYNAGQGNVDKYGGVPPFEETQRYIKNILGGQQAASTGQPTALNRTSQFAMGLSDADAYAACGPAAAVAFARANGRNPTPQEAMQLAQQSGWTQAGGMNGVVNQKKLLDALGVATKLETGSVDWSKVASEAQGGNPVIVSTPHHYFTVDGAQSGPNGTVFHVGTSGTDLKAGSEWMTGADMQRVMGTANGALFTDHPAAQGPSIAETVSNVARNVSSAVQVKAQDLMNAVTQTAQSANQSVQADPTRTPLSPIGDVVTGALHGAGDMIANSGINQFRRENFPNFTEPGHPLNPETPLDTPQAALMFGGMAGPVGGGNVVGALAKAEQAVADLRARFPQMSEGSLAASAPGKELAALRAQAPAPRAAPPEMTQPLPSVQSRPNDVYRGGEPPVVPGQQYTRDPQGNIIPLPQPQPSIDTVTGLQNMAKQRGAEPTPPQPTQPATQPPITMSTPGQPLMTGNFDPVTGQRVPGGPISMNTPGQPLMTGNFDPVTGQRIQSPPVDPATVPGNMFGADTYYPGSAEPQGAWGKPRYDSNDILRGYQPGQASPQFAASLGGAAAGGAGAYMATDENDPNRWAKVAGGALAGGALTSFGISAARGAQNAVAPALTNTAPATGAELFRSYHTNNVISGLATLTHVAVNSILAPAWSFLSRGAADIAGGMAGMATGGRIGLDTGFSRVQGSGIGVAAGLASAGEDFGAALARHFIDPNTVANRAGGIGGAALNVQGAFGALHGAAQAAAQGIIARTELGRLAGEAATQQGLKGSAWTQAVSQMIDSPAAGMLKEAEGVAQRAALRGDLGSLGSTMQKIANVPYIGNTLFPVVKIAANALAQGVEKSPLGLLGTGFDVLRGGGRLGLPAGPYGGAAGFAGNGTVAPLAERLTNNIAGTAVTAWLLQKSQDGTITGSGPTDPKARAMLTSQGWQPNSIYIPGRGYTDYHVLGPLAIPLSIAGNYHDAVEYAKSGANAEAIALDLANRVGGYLADATGLRTIGQMYNVLHGGPSVGALAAQFGGSLVGGFVPESALVRGLVTASDPELRKGQPGNMQNVIQQGLPGGTPLIGGRQDLPVKQDVLGRPEANPQAGLGTFLPRAGSGEADPVLSLLAASDVNLGPPSKIIHYAGKQIQLTPDEQQQLEQIRGERIQKLVAPYLTSQRFPDLPQEQQFKLMEGLVRQASQYADQRIIAQIPTDERKARTVAVEHPSAGVLPTMAAASMARSVANAGDQSAAARHSALMQQLSQRPQPSAA